MPERGSRKRKGISKRKSGKPRLIWLAGSIAAALLSLLLARRRSGVLQWTHDEEEAERVALLIRWIRNEGGFVHPSVAVREGPHGRGVFLVGGDLNEGDRFLQVPESCFFSVRTIFQTSDTNRRAAFSQVDQRLLESENELVILALALTAEKYSAKSSFWRPYLDALPSIHPDQPLFWTADQLEELQSPIVVEQINQSKTFLRSKLPLLHKLAEEYPQLYPRNNDVDDDVLVDHFIWAYYTVVSRSFDVPGARDSRGHPDPDDFVTGLVPFLDLLNHAFGTVTAEQTLTVILPQQHLAYTSSVATGAIPTDQSKVSFLEKELVHQYQSSSSSSIKNLYRYGMMDSDYESRVAGDYILLRWNSGNDDDDRLAWTVCANGSILDWDDDDTISSPMDRVALAKELAPKVAAALEAIPTSLDHDKALLRSLSSSSSSSGSGTNTNRSALVLRIRFKQVLHKLLRWLHSGAPSGETDGDCGGSPSSALFELKL